MVTLMMMMMMMLAMIMMMTMMMIIQKFFTKIGFRHSTLRRSRDSKGQDDISVEFPSLK